MPLFVAFTTMLALLLTSTPTPGPGLRPPPGADTGGTGTRTTTTAVAATAAATTGTTGRAGATRRPGTTGWAGAARERTITLLPGRRESPDVEGQLRAYWERLEIVVERYNRVRDDFAATRARSAALTARIRPLQAAVRAREARLGTLVARAYRSGGVVEANALLVTAAPEQFAERLLVVRRLASQQSEALAALRRAREHYESSRAELDALAAEQYRRQERLAAGKRNIEAQIHKLERLRAGVRGWYDGRQRPHNGYVPAYAPGPAGAAVRFAYRQLGKPYRWGGSGPYGYDCSGLTSAAWHAGGTGLPHNAARQWQSVTPISRAELRQGDLVFYYRDIHHVALYVGAGKVIHAPTHGERVRVEPMGYAPIYGYGRP